MVALLDADRVQSARCALYRFGQVPLAVSSGLLATAATLSLLGGLIWGSTLPRGHLFLCAAIFAGVLVGAFSWIYGATSVDGVHVDGAARVGVLALVITVAATTACPDSNVLWWWDRSRSGESLSRLLGDGGSSLLLGFGYGVVPGFLASLFGGRLLEERPAVNSLAAAALAFLLAVPLMYLQSARFTCGVIASWLIGAALGTICGVSGALRVRGWLWPAPWVTVGVE